MKTLSLPGQMPDLKGPRVILRRPLEEDIPTRLAIGRHREIVEAYGGVFDPDAPFLRHHAEAAIRFIESQPSAWVIATDRYVGHVRLHAIEQADRRALLAIGIDDPACLGLGYGTEALRLVLAFAFEIGFHRIGLRVLASNARAIASYRKCGFVEEGREREAALVGGAWQDDVIMGVLATDVA